MRRRRYRVGGSYLPQVAKTVFKERAFKNFDELLAHAEGPTDLPDHQRESRVGTRSFTGTDSFEQAMHQARYGWPEGLKKIAKVTDAIKAIVAQKAQLKNDSFYAMSGAVVDVGRFLSGEPECMLDFEVNEQAGRKIFSVTLNASASCCVDKDTLYNRGAAVIALVDLLERGGYSCEVNVLEVTARGSKQYVIRVPVKHAGEQLDMERMAFAIASPSFLRRLAFSIGEREDLATRQLFGFYSYGGYGSPSNLPTTYTDEEKGVYLPALFGYCDFNEQESAVQWVIDQASKLLALELETPSEVAA